MHQPSRPNARRSRGLACGLERLGGRIPVVLITGLAFLGCSQAPPPEPDRPNVLILLIDALRADRLGVNGYPLPTTPVIDRLASEGLNFRQAFAHSTWTKPSIATLMTSLYPGQHGLEQVAVEEGEGLAGEVLGDALTTLSERFQAAGYATCGVVNQVHLKPQFGFSQGFDYFAAERGVGALGINGRLLKWLEGGSGRPFFAYLHYLDVHWPYTKRVKGKRAVFGRANMTREPPQQGHLVDAWARDHLGDSELEALRVRYDREVAFADDAVGRLLAGLRERGLYEDTVIVVTSDHGEGFLEHGELQHGYSPYDELIRVPLVVRLPSRLRVSTGAVDTPVGLIDLMPTLLDLTGLDPDPQARGMSLAPAFVGKELRPRPVFAETADAVAVRTSRYKLIRFIDGRREFFDLAADPGETRPIGGPCVGECGRLLQALEGYLLLISDTRMAGGRVRLSVEELEDLRSLGYLD